NVGVGSGGTQEISTPRGASTNEYRLMSTTSTESASKYPNICSTTIGMSPCSALTFSSSVINSLILIPHLLCSLLGLHMPLLLTPVRTAPHAHAHNITRISVEVIGLKVPARCGIVLSNHIARVVRDHSDNLFRFRRRLPRLHQPMAGNCPAS